MSYLDWHVGMKVVCVDIEWPPDAAAAVAKGCRLPEPGRIYTIREIGIAQDGNVYVRLCEIRNPRVSLKPWQSSSEPQFGARRFRPAQTRKTDISIFTAMLHDKHHKVPA